MTLALSIIACIVVSWIAFQGIRFAFLLRASKELVARSNAYERHINGGSPRIFVMGDSTGVGTGGDPEGSIAGRFAQEFPRADIWNSSINGLTIDGLLQAFPTLDPASFDLIVLQIGANDIIRGTPIDEFETSLRAVFDRATAAGTHVVALHSGNIGLAPMFPWPVSRIMRARTLRYREVYQQVAAEKGVTYVNLYHEKNTDTLSKNIPLYYAADQLHLTSAGYGVWYAAIREAMTAAATRL